LKTLPGYDPDIQNNRAQARQLMHSSVMALLTNSR